MPIQKEVTNLLIRAGAGNKTAHDQLMLRVYDELRALAKRFLLQERMDHTLQPTALVHEAYMRLVDQDKAGWNNQAHFFRVAAKMMRRVLVDHARRRLAKKRGGDARRLPITQVSELGIKEDEDLIAIDEALDELSSLDPQKCKIVELRFFAGLSVEKTARVLDLSIRSVEREWSMARLWLYRRIGLGNNDGPEEMAAD
ncbi:MAG: sigma-70 family RNA polymerase sigma factor [Planctomycetes bacterium]|nr:sigma-70 family RNA polymerase sigma factor [Planctomycetota bacterium]